MVKNRIKNLINYIYLKYFYDIEGKPLSSNAKSILYNPVIDGAHLYFIEVLKCLSKTPQIYKKPELLKYTESLILVLYQIGTDKNLKKESNFEEEEVLKFLKKKEYNIAFFYLFDWRKTVVKDYNSNVIYNRFNHCKALQFIIKNNLNY